MRGLTIACNKRPVTVDQIEQLTAAVEAHVFAAETREITTRQIGQWTLEELLVVDEVAYVRFASVFHRFESLDEFLGELNRIRTADAGSLSG